MEVQAQIEGVIVKEVKRLREALAEKDRTRSYQISRALLDWILRWVPEDLDGVDLQKQWTGEPVLGLDFDGTLTDYRNGWRGPTTIEDGPAPGAQDFCRRALAAGFRLAVYSSRSGMPGGIKAMREWCARNGFPEGLEFWTTKPPAHVTLDDRAMTFSGCWPDPEDLKAFRPWYKREENP